MEPPSSTVNTCLSVLQKIPPKKTGLAFEVLKEALASKRPDALSELMKRVVDFPLPVQSDATKDKKFLLCEFNKQGDIHRSPYDAEQNLSDELRTFESHANEVWEAYTHLYYGKEAVGSVYVKDAGGAAGVLVACFLLKKSVEHDERLAEGEWNSAHMVHVGNVSNGSSKYKVSSTVTISMDATNESNFSATVSRDTEQVHPVRDLASHLENVGKMIESIEIDVRSSLENVMIPKTREVVSVLRRDGRGGGALGGIPVMIPRPKKKSGLPAGAMAMPGMGGGAHAAALNAAVLKRAPKK